MSAALDLARLRRDVDGALERLLPPPEGAAARLHEAMRYAVFSGGKRLRPILAIAACEAFGGSAPRILAPAGALEMIHTYSLVHDDLPAMDDDDFRRGKPSSHKKFDEATAILAGDALLTAAFEAVARTPDKTLVAPMTLTLAEAAGAAGMVGGQQIDLSPKADVHEIHAKKTAALFQASTHLGALAARSPKAANLARYGLHLGLAFQAVDDILDFSEEGRRNVAKIYGLKHAHKLAAQEVAAAKAAVRFMGVNGERLRQIADFVLSRKH